jgi:hypothetical protein
VQFHPCDKRRSVTELAKQFPGADFSLVKDDEDILWKPEAREDDAHIQVRVYLVFALMMIIKLGRL